MANSDRKPRATRAGNLTLDIAPGVPLHLVRAEALDGWVQTAPVTQGQFHGFDPHIPNTGQPLTGVPWDRARAFCAWLNDQFGPDIRPAGYLFRLPRQWEWAGCARCEVRQEPAWGDRCPGFGRREVLQQIPLAHHTGSEPNAWGLADLENGLWEWTEDIFDPDMNRRIIRGACWFGLHEGARQFLFFRTPEPHVGHPDFGFRLMLGRPIPGSNPTPMGEH